MKTKKSIVTGGAGFIGSNLVDHLIKVGHKVIVIDNFVSGKKSNLSHHKKTNVKIVKLDISKSKKLDHSTKLIGNVEQQFIITKSTFKKILEKEIISSIKKYYLEVLGIKVKKVTIDSAWIVCQFAGDFNPPHIHRGNISGVGYLKMPRSIILGSEKGLAGYISFMDGRVSMPRNSPPLVQHRQSFKPKIGNLFIFPSFLMHDVHPFRGSGERRSFSFNAFVDS